MKVLGVVGVIYKNVFISAIAILDFLQKSTKRSSKRSSKHSRKRSNKKKNHSSDWVLVHPNDLVISDDIKQFHQFELKYL